MGLEFKKVWVILLIIGLTLFGIPIRVRKNGDEEHEHMFHSYVQKFNKSYSNSTEFSERFNNFKHSLETIDQLNRNRSSNISAVYGLTKFSDMSALEFSKHCLGHSGSHHQHHHHRKESNSKYKNENGQPHGKFVKRSLSVAKSLPQEVDWRNKNFVTPVRDQGLCGACWAFSTIETLETMNAIRTGSLQSLSVQQVVDCSRNGNRGCEGGDACHLLEWIVSKNITIETANEYPLTRETDMCKMKQTGDGVKVAPNFTCESFVNKEDLILSYLAFHGPVAVAVNAINWQNYLGGVIQFHCDGKPAMMNHAVQLVGYQKNSPVPHYIARNSWGTDFGDKGYIYIAMGSNLCGVANEVAILDAM